MDTFKEGVKDPRFDKALNSLNDIEENENRINSEFIIENVLDQDGV